MHGKMTLRNLKRNRGNNNDLPLHFLPVFQQKHYLKLYKSLNVNSKLTQYFKRFKDPNNIFF